MEKGKGERKSKREGGGSMYDVRSMKCVCIDCVLIPMWQGLSFRNENALFPFLLLPSGEMVMICWIYL